MSVAGFGTEYWPDLEDALEVAANGHLLVQLRTLSQASLLLKVPKTIYKKK